MRHSLRVNSNTTELKLGTSLAYYSVCLILKSKGALMTARKLTNYLIFTLLIAFSSTSMAASYIAFYSGPFETSYIVEEISEGSDSKIRFYSCDMSRKKSNLVYSDELFEPGGLLRLAKQKKYRSVCKLHGDLTKDQMTQFAEAHKAQYNPIVSLIDDLFWEQYDDKASKQECIADPKHLLQNRVSCNDISFYYTNIGQADGTNFLFYEQQEDRVYQYLTINEVETLLWDRYLHMAKGTETIEILGLSYEFFETAPFEDAIAFIENRPQDIAKQIKKNLEVKPSASTKSK
jgi:hypothetical protein